MSPHLLSPPEVPAAWPVPLKLDNSASSFVTIDREMGRELVATSWEFSLFISIYFLGQYVFIKKISGMYLVRHTIRVDFIPKHDRK